MTQPDDEAFDAALARALNAGAEGTAPLSRAVLSRLAEPSSIKRTTPAEVLAQPLPAAGLLFGLLGLAVALGYVVGPASPDEVSAIAELLGLGL